MWPDLLTWIVYALSDNLKDTVKHGMHIVGYSHKQPGANDAVILAVYNMHPVQSSVGRLLLCHVVQLHTPNIVQCKQPYGSPAEASG